MVANGMWMMKKKNEKMKKTEVHGRNGKDKNGERKKDHEKDEVAVRAAEKKMKSHRIIKASVTLQTAVSTDQWE